jgi:hypothetical protein
MDKISPGRKGEEGHSNRRDHQSQDVDMGKHQVSLGRVECDWSIYDQKKRILLSLFRLLNTYFMPDDILSASSILTFNLYNPGFQW